MYRLAKFILFTLPPETAHYFALYIYGTILKIPGLRSFFRKKYTPNHPSAQITLWNLTFTNPVGLAAGFDKDGRYLKELSTFGFGFVEVGTVTPKSQNGNPKPRLFRLPADRALINRMGFNNEGVTSLFRRLKEFDRGSLIIGGNIGKNKDTPAEDTIADYLFCFQELYDVVDYFVINVSSPNTPNLRNLQDKEPLGELLKAIQLLNHSMPQRKPVLLKIAPDLTWTQIDDILEVVRETETDGIIATNTTVERKNLLTRQSRIDKIGSGGLSGKPLRVRSTEIIRYIHRKTAGKLPIIAVGGIFTPSDAIEKINAGASLIQVYTGLIYDGPHLIKRINQALTQQHT